MEIFVEYNKLMDWLSVSAPLPGRKDAENLMICKNAIQKLILF